MATMKKGKATFWVSYFIGFLLRTYRICWMRTDWASAGRVGWPSLCIDGVGPFEEIEDALWALIHALARRRNFLEHTDHLSDEQLYDVLWEQVLEEPTSVFPECCRWSCEISICDYGSPNGDDGLITFLRHYADEHFRREWEQEFPDQPLPIHRDPPYERDYLLPAPDRFLDEEEEE